MTLDQIPLDPPALKLFLCIVGGLLLIAMVRILFLLRTNNRLRESTSKMEKQVLTQHQEILAVRQDSNAWRGETQRMFDAFRAEFSKRLAESEQRYQDIQHKQQELEKSAPPPPKPEPVVEKAVLPVPSISLS